MSYRKRIYRSRGRARGRRSTRRYRISRGGIRL